MVIFPKVQFIEGIFEDIAPNKKFDLAILHNVTEHLHNLDQVFDGIKNRLKKNGKILFNHHNYYCWNGHHQMPKKIYDINLSDKNQLKYIDWNHLNFAKTSNDKLAKKLNKITINQLLVMTEKYFEIEIWDEIISRPKEGIDRLTDEILKKHHKYSKKDLATQHIFCVGNLKCKS
jgi:SAM-dependent methyltransferase